MYTSAIKTGMRYLAASIVIAAAAAVYGLFSHGVYSYFMTYAFMVPLLAGALPHLTAALKTACGKACGSLYEKISGAKDAQLALVATLTAGSLLKGVLEARAVEDHIDGDGRKGGDRRRDQQVKLEGNDQDGENDQRNKLDHGDKSAVLRMFHGRILASQSFCE